jgi:hypothetical protein
MTRMAQLWLVATESKPKMALLAMHRTTINITKMAL